jgi:hypothetical protein
MSQTRSFYHTVLLLAIGPSVGSASFAGETGCNRVGAQFIAPASQADAVAMGAMMQINKLLHPSVGADYALSKINTDYETSRYAAMASFIIHI